MSHVGKWIGRAAFGLWLAALAAPAFAQDAGPPPAWADPALLEAARAEGSLTVYSSMNEREGLPLWKLFEQATGIKVQYVRASDTALLARIALEARGGQNLWDVLVSTAVIRLPGEFLAPIDPPEAKNILPQARGADKKWYGVYANYNTPSYNTKFVKKSDLPTTYEGFLAHKEWAGKVVIDHADTQWLSGMFSYYGEQRARKLIGEIVATLHPVLADGHLALARSVAAGEYWIALNNFVNLTLNQQLSGGPTDFWPLDPTALFFGQVGASAHAPHPNAARLAANFLLSKEAQQRLPHAGRIPVRKDVTPNPPDTLERLAHNKVVAVHFTSDEEKKWRKTFQDLFHPR